ncbi:MAG: ATP-binding protein, partial [Coraliomargarita sp.]
RLTALQMDRAGRLWALAESSEIFCLSGQQPARSFRPESFGLGDSGANGIVAGLYGGLWLSTDTEGLAYASSAHLQAVLEGRQAEPGLIWFDGDSGLSTTSCSGKPSGLFRSRDGRIWVANPRGVSVIDPAIWQARLDRFPDVPVSIDAGILDGVPTGIAHTGGVSKLRVGPSVRKIEIRFGSTHHTFLGRPRYRYRLLGFASEWVDTQGQNFTVYQNLPPGRYSFEVNAGLPDGRWSAHRSQLRLQVDAHWFEHRAFRAAMVFALFAALAALFALRVRHLKQRSRRQEAFTRKLLESQEEERKRIAGELHDSLGQDLILIKNSSELAKRKVGSDAVSMSSLEDISEIATHAINEARAITANLRPLELDRVGLRSAVQTMLDRIAEHSEIAVDADLSALEAGWPPPDDISLYRVLQEVLNNAMKHSAARNLCIQTSTTDSWLVLLIHDDGVGFDLEKLRQRSARTGLGLESLQERIQLLQGKLTLESAPGKGTRIRIVVPLRDGTKAEG